MLVFFNLTSGPRSIFFCEDENLSKIDAVLIISVGDFKYLVANQKHHSAADSLNCYARCHWMKNIVK